jgi:hypothetical protein
MTRKPLACPPFVILPGFFNAATDYYDPFGRGQELGLAAALGRRGVTSYVLPLERKEWLKVHNNCTLPVYCAIRTL